MTQTPASNNNFLYQMGVGSQDNPALFGSPQGLETTSGAAFRLPGFNPNSAFRPHQNTGAESQSVRRAVGHVRSLGAILDSNRWQRQPAESLSLARNFRVKERYEFPVRAEFQNLFNRVFYLAPATGNPTGGAYTRQATKTPSRL